MKLGYLLLVAAFLLAVRFVVSDLTKEKVPEKMKTRVEVSDLDGSVDKADQYIKAAVKDPGGVVYHQWSNRVSDPWHVTTVDFTAKNGFGGPVRETWTFKFDRTSGELKSVFNGRKYLLDLTGEGVK